MRNTVMTVSEVARSAFQPGFYLKGALRPEHRADTQQKLAQALAPSGVSPIQVEQLAEAVRSVGDAEEFAPDQSVTARQKSMLAKMMADPTSPVFRDILQAASPHLAQRRDVYALSGVLVGTKEKLEHLALRTAKATAKARA